MKKLIALAVLTFALAAHAQWTVFDPTMNVQQIIDTAQQLAKYAVMINNQVQQIQTLNTQQTEFKKYEAVFGNPASTSLPTLPTLVNDLNRTEVGVPLTTLQTTASPNQAMTYNGGGLFQAVGTTFTTPKGQTVTRQQSPYVPIAAIQNTTSNYLSVSTNIEARRVALKQDIASTIDQLKAATAAPVVRVEQFALQTASPPRNRGDCGACASRQGRVLYLPPHPPRNRGDCGDVDRDEAVALGLRLTPPGIAATAAG